MERDLSCGTSSTTATILLVALTIMLALLVLLLFRLPSFDWTMTEPLPIVEIRELGHASDIAPYALNYDSRVILVHNGTAPLENRPLKARIYRNDVLIPARITTLNGHDFISTAHYGVQWIGGAGCSGSTWTYGEVLVIDLSDGTFRPNDRIRVEILSGPLDSLISRDTAIA